MRSDGQLYSMQKSGRVSPPPPLDPSEAECDCTEIKPQKNGFSLGQEELLIIGLVLLIISDKCETDLPLVLALLYILFRK